MLGTQFVQVSAVFYRLTKREQFDIIISNVYEKGM